MDHIFKELLDRETGEDFKISIEFEEDGFNLNILRDSNAWCASVSHEMIESQSKAFVKTANEYYLTLQGFLRNLPSNIEFKLTKKEFEVRLVPGVKYFVCKLKKDNYAHCVERLISKFYSERNQLSEHVQALTAEKNSLETSSVSLENKLKELVDIKKCDENDLYNGFVMVLNEKKKKIQHLYELIEAFRQNRPTVNPPTRNKKEKSSNTKIKVESDPTVYEEGVQSEKSEDDYNTDDEKAINSPESTKMTDLTLKQHCDLLSDDSSDEFILPKRQKTSDSAFNASQPSTSKCPVDTKPLTAKVNENIEESSPAIKLSTQDLLDFV